MGSLRVGPRSELETEEEDPNRLTFRVERVVEEPHIVPMTCGDREFKIAMRQVEIHPGNFIWEVRLHREEDAASGGWQTVMVPRPNGGPRPNASPRPNQGPRPNESPATSPD